MKIIPLLAVLFIVGGCAMDKSGKLSQQTAQDFQQLYWLVGDWERTNSKPGRNATESWKKQSDFVLEGTGIVRSGGDTLFVEKLSLLIKDDAIYYVAELSENPAPTFFKLTAIDSQSFVAENPQHDFPKMISYQLQNDKLNVETSGDGKVIPFLFKRK